MSTFTFKIKNKNKTDIKTARLFGYSVDSNDSKLSKDIEITVNDKPHVEFKRDYKDYNIRIRGLEFDVKSVAQINQEWKISEEKKDGSTMSVKWNPFSFRSDKTQATTSIIAPLWEILITNDVFIDIPMLPEEEVKIIFTLN